MYPVRTQLKLSLEDMALSGPPLWAPSRVANESRRGTIRALTKRIRSSSLNENNDRYAIAEIRSR